jgi:hypothetical protein
MALESMTDVLTRLESAGYETELRAQDSSLSGGELTADPEAFSVDEVIRFEGESDPDDEAAVFALTHRESGTKGVYIVAYGAEMDPADTEVASRLGG